MVGAQHDHMMRPRTWSVVSLFVLVAACGGEDDNASTSSTGGSGPGAGGSGTGTGMVGGGGTGGTGGGGGASVGGGGMGGGTAAGTLSIMLAGQTSSADLPGAVNGYLGGQLDGMVARLDVPGDGSAPSVVWSRFIGGSDFEQVRDIAVDGMGAAFVTGRMASTDMATTSDAQQPNYGGGPMDAFVVQIAADGSMPYSSYFGGNNYDVGYGMVVAPDGRLVVSGRTSSTNMPTTPGSAQPNYAGGTSGAPYFGGDYFAFLLSGGGTIIDWGTYAGGSADDAGRGRAAMDPSGNVWVGGRSLSNDFPAVNSKQGASDGAVVRIAADGASMTGLYLGGSDDLDGATGGTLPLSDGTTIICGYSASSDFPVSNGAAQATHGGGFDGMIAHVSADGTQILAATYLGGSGYEECQGVDVTSDGDIVAVGITNSNDFPFTSGGGLGGNDVWVARLSSDLGSLDFAIAVGGSGDDVNDASRIWVTPSGQLLVAGSTSSADLPVTPDAFQSTFAGGPDDAFVALVAADGSGLPFVSYFGGSGSDFPRAVAFHQAP